MNARHLHCDEAIQRPTATRGAVSLIADPGNVVVQRAKPRDNLVRKLVSAPMVLDDRGDLTLHEVPHASDDRSLVWDESFSNFVEVAIDWGRGVLLLASERSTQSPYDPPLIDRSTLLASALHRRP